MRSLQMGTCVSTNLPPVGTNQVTAPIFTGATVVCSIVLILAVGCAVFVCCCVKWRPDWKRGVLFVGVLVQVVFRLVYFIYLLAGRASSDPAPFIFNRLEFLAASETILLLWYYWFSVVHADNTRRVVYGVRIVFLVCATLIVIFFLIMFLLSYCLITLDAFHLAEFAVYNGVIVGFSVFITIESVGVVVYTVWLAVLLRRQERGRGTERQVVVQYVLTIVVPSILLALFSLGQAICFFYRPITGLLFDFGVFNAFAYILPLFFQTAPVLFLIFYAGLSSWKSARLVTQFDEPLIEDQTVPLQYRE